MLLLLVFGIIAFCCFTVSAIDAAAATGVCINIRIKWLEGIHSIDVVVTIETKEIQQLSFYNVATIFQSLNITAHHCSSEW